MAQIAGARALYSEQVTFREAAVQMYSDVADRIESTLRRAANVNGIIPPRQETDVVRAVGELALRMFVGEDGRSAFARDGITALAPYPEALNRSVARVTAAVVKAHHDWLKRHAPEDVFEWIAAVQPVRELSVRIEPSKVFHPDPLAQYDPLHLWVDPNGYRLSDRVWQGGVRTRQQLDALVAEQIRNGNSAINIAKKAEQFLLPNRAPLRTKRPYGRDASFDGMRLGRTEITAGHGRAALAAARANPFVVGMTWKLSLRHPKTDHCDVNAANSPYALDRVPTYPDHPFCLCVLVPEVAESPAAVTEALRELMAAGEQPPYVTPANQDGFLFLLLGGLADLARG